jgi:hypothetical protein
MVGILVYVREFSLNICGRTRRRKMLVTLQDPADDPRRKSEGGIKHGLMWMLLLKVTKVGLCRWCSVWLDEG